MTSSIGKLFIGEEGIFISLIHSTNCFVELAYTIRPKPTNHGQLSTWHNVRLKYIRSLFFFLLEISYLLPIVLKQILGAVYYLHLQPGYDLLLKLPHLQKLELIQMVHHLYLMRFQQVQHSVLNVYNLYYLSWKILLYTIFVLYPYCIILIFAYSK